MPLAFLFQAMSIFAFYMTCRARWIDFGSIQIFEDSQSTRAARGSHHPLPRMGGPGLHDSCVEAM